MVSSGTRLLFVGDSLLVAKKYWGSDDYSVSALRTTEGRLEEQRGLTTVSEGIVFRYWFHVGDRLVLWNWTELELNKSEEDLYIYSVKFDG